MTETEEKIIGAAIRTFVRYGARKTAMADIASEAGVSRQTLYDTFGGKDDLIVAAIRYITDQNLGAVRENLAGSETLASQLDTYFSGTVIKSFELLQSSVDAENEVYNHSKSGRAEIERSHEKHRALLTELLTPHKKVMAKSGQTPRKLAHFIVTVVMALKYSARDRDDLDALLDSLKTAALCVTNSEA